MVLQHCPIPHAHLPPLPCTHRDLGAFVPPPRTEYPTPAPVPLLGVPHWPLELGLTPAWLEWALVKPEQDLCVCKKQILTQTHHGEDPGGIIGGNAVGEDRLQDIVGEGQCNDSQASWVHDKHCTPQQQKPGETRKSTREQCWCCAGGGDTQPAVHRGTGLGTSTLSHPPVGPSSALLLCSQHNLYFK